jgi:hypothetical protein
MPLHGGRLFALALLRRLLVELAAAKLSQHPGFFASTLEAAQRGIEIFVLFNANTWHLDQAFLLGINNPGSNRESRAF